MLKKKTVELDHWIRAIAGGDTDALASLYQETSPSVYAYALSALKNSHDAEDVMQDCYVAVYTSSAVYRASGKPMAWIITIARNLCLHRLRANRYRAELSDEDWGELLPDRTELTMEDRVILRACMQILGDEERQILTLHTIGGLKHREIADLLEMPLSTVLSKYRRALKKLRRVLE